MSKWIFEPGHTEARFKAKHMMITWVNGLFKNIEGTLNFDEEKMDKVSFQFEIESAKLWTGVEERDTHLKSSDFFDVENHPKITFKTTQCKKMSANRFEMSGDLTIRGIAKPVSFFMDYLGEWQTPYWTEKGNKGSVKRVGFSGKCVINRHDWKVSWNDEMDRGGFVVSNEIYIDLNIEALLESEMKQLS